MQNMSRNTKGNLDYSLFYVALSLKKERRKKVEGYVI